jgi:hypothetical protein
MDVNIISQLAGLAWNGHTIKPVQQPQLEGGHSYIASMPASHFKLQRCLHTARGYFEFHPAGQVSSTTEELHHSPSNLKIGIVRSASVLRPSRP